MEKSIDVEKLKELLESGTSMADALKKLGHDHFSDAINQLGALTTKANTRACPLSEQYCGCYVN